MKIPQVEKEKLRKILTLRRKSKESKKFIKFKFKKQILSCVWRFIDRDLHKYNRKKQDMDDDFDLLSSLWFLQIVIAAALRTRNQ